MKPLFKVNQRDFDDYIPVIGESLDHWQLVTIALTKECYMPYDELIAKIIDHYQDYPGFIYNLGYKRVVVFVKMGAVSNFSHMRTKLIDNLAMGGLLINVRVVTKETLNQFQKTFMTPDTEYSDHFDVCEDRKTPLLMIADDDPMVLKLMEKILSPIGNIETVASGKDVLQRYSELKPNALFLDIHMPEVHGLNNLARITTAYPFSFVSMLSADSIAPRILKGLQYGAYGFIGKPVQRQRILDFLQVSPTIRV